MTISKTSLFKYSLVFVLTFVVGAAYLSVPRAADATKAGALTITMIATDLHNPRGLNFAPNGSLYVAEAGGNGTASQTQCGVMGDGQTKCYATTGSITRIDMDTLAATRVLTELPSLISANGTGNGASGVHDISFHGMGNSYVTMGLGGDPTLRGSYFGADGQNFARLGRFNPSGRFRLHENLGDYEAANNPDGFVPDSNPYGVLALPGRVVIADAGGNDLIQVSARGVISTLAVFPPIPRPPPGPPFVQAVPTSVALGPDGDFYVGVLTGGPFTIGLANVYRVPAGGGTPVVAHTGFTNIIDIAFGPDGSLYVLEIARNAIPNFGAGGRLVRIAPDGTRTDIVSGPPLIAPGGVAVGSDGALYITNRSTSPTIGEVLRIEP